MIDQQENLYLGPGLFLGPEQTGGDDSGIVDDQAVTCPQIIPDIVKMSVLHGPGLRIQNQKAGLIPL